MNSIINNDALTNSLNEFAKENKIKNKKFDNLRSRRKSIVNLIKDYSKEKNLYIIDQFNVGSYKIKTGVERSRGEGWAFDIDYILVYKKEFDYETFKNNIIHWLREQVKKRYQRHVIVKNKKKVISVAFRNQENTKTEFYLDIALYIEKNGDLYHIKRNENGKYDAVKGKPKETNERQKNALGLNDDKRNAIILLKYLKEKNRIKGASSIFITDEILSYSNDFDTFTLIKTFIQENISITSFKLKELPHSELIDNSLELNSSLWEMNQKFFQHNNTYEIYKSMNSWFDNNLPELEKDLMEDRNERYCGG